MDPRSKTPLQRLRAVVDARVATAIAATILISLSFPNPALSDPRDQELESLKREVEALKKRDEEYRRSLNEMNERLERALSTASEQPVADGETVSPREALDAALEATKTPEETAQDAAAYGTPNTDVWNRRVGPTNLRLIDISADILFAGGGSTADDDELEELDGGAHDPNKNGFTLQGAELSLSGAVDPYFRGEVHVIALTDGIEVEEAFAQTTSLPGGLQLEGGLFFTEFGVLNPRHPHQWDWIDQPVINTRLFGGDGLRSEGIRVGWLTPLSWPSEFHFGVQNANTEDFTASFIGDDPVGGRPQNDRDVDDPGDLLWLARWVNSWDHTDEWTSVFGVSGLYGPNDAGSDTDTWIYGFDYRLKWVPRDNFRGYPFVSWQTEVMRRDYEVDSYGAAAGGDPDFPNDLPSETLNDMGGYTQLLWGFMPNWSAGLRLEYADASGDSVEDGELVSHNDDPARDRRWRFSPLLTWWPSHFSRLRLQYNYDNAKFLDDDDAHTVWMGMEVLFGAHTSHTY